MSSGVDHAGRTTRHPRVGCHAPKLGDCRMRRRTLFTGAPRPTSSRRPRAGISLLTARTTAGLLPVALVAGLLGAWPAAAAEAEPVLESYDRMLVVDYWRSGGAGVKAAAEQALLGSDADIKKFLDGTAALQYDDNYVEASRIFNVGGPAVRTAAKQALKGTPETLTAFLKAGWRAPLNEDRQVEVSRIINLGGNGVKDAGKAALKGTPDDIAKFLNEGQYAARETDDEVAVSKLATSGGPNVKAAAKVALRGTPDDIREFLEIGQFTARNRDQEYATVAQLTEDAKQAGIQAEDATKSAEEASARAIAASALAKEAAQKAAYEAGQAKNDANRAAIKATQAADAARAAASAAQQAISSANAASRAARIAALAAAQTASAAAAAANAANDAYNAAIAAGSDATQASRAKDLAGIARNAAALVETSALAAEQAGKASYAAGLAAKASQNAGANANLAADAAEQANNYADAAGNSSAEARQAAADARRHANAANAAADKASSLAQRSANAAYASRDAARSAAKHARAAADAADAAAAHAGQAANAAAESKKHAEAAKVAAEAADTAVQRAKDVFDIARENEAADLATRTEAAIERARSRKAQTDTYISAAASQQLEGTNLDAAANALAAEASKPNADVKATATKGRALALKAMKLRGPWSQEAAAAALSGTDAQVLDYLRTGWKQAGRDEIRERVFQLSGQSPYLSVRTAAAGALTGSEQQIADFYTTGQYAAGTDDLAVEVSKFNNFGGPGVKDASKKALANGSGKALATFLAISQYSARTSDEQVIASKLVNEGGPEVKAAAKIALAGPADQLHDFVTVGQYMAAHKDKLADHHKNQVERLIAEASGIAAKANQNRWRAAEAAAKANQAKNDADAAVIEANKSAESAAKYASDAKKSATAAEASATAAKNSAAAARNAAAAADRDADAAEDSAAQAAFSAKYARDSAARANESATRARESATAAGKSAEEANTLASQAWNEVKVKREAEEATARRQAEEARKKQAEAEKKKKPKCIVPFNRDSLPPCMMAGADPDEIIFAKPDADLAKLVLKGAWELSGGADVQRCIEEPTWGGCTMAVIGVIPAGKAVKVLKWGSEGVQSLAEARKLQKLVGCAVAAANSFPAGTRVLMGNGSARPIEQVGVGDAVLATDPETGVTGPRRVDATIYTPDDRDFTEITLGATNGSGSVTATDHHPFWSERTKEWKDAADLDVGDTLRTSDGRSAEITAVRHWKTLQPAYNLTVKGLHTYYVLAAGTPVLVHNTTPPCGLPAEALEQAWPSWNTAQNLEHVIDAEKHGFQDIVAKAGGREAALRAIMDSLDGATDLPGIGKYIVKREIHGEMVTIRGAMVNGIPRLGTAFIEGKFPG
ncbi:polymorphic toxin-type HINT domain-containing protein [Streptomyces sp. NPDC091268]|uniref:polymorphic toxin-type HINT domain-containing protein n=1 Tax=Streptomyces sp. NPDC091268 TaxID=3365979 RepID=UPI00381461CE